MLKAFNLPTLSTFTMIAFLLLLLHGSIDVGAQLAEANAQLARVEPYPIDSPRDVLRDLVEKYQAIEASPKYASEAYAGEGKCLMLQGYLEDAEKAFHKAGPRYVVLENRAKSYEDVAVAIEAHLPKHFQVDQLRRVPGTETWVAIYGPDDEDSVELQRLALYKYDPVREEAKQIGPAKQTHDYYALERCTLYLVYLTSAERSWHPLVFSEWSGDRVPVYTQIYDIVASGLRFKQELDSTSGMSVYPPSPNGGLYVSGSLNWKLGWNDVFEWSGHGFVVANSRHPDLFPIERTSGGGAGSADAWPEELMAACTYAIHKQYAQARTWLSAAERHCSKRTSDDPEHLTTQENLCDGPANALPAIRRRLRWLSAHEYNHELLYRPVADNMIVPPPAAGT